MPRRLVKPFRHRTHPPSQPLSMIEQINLRVLSALAYLIRFLECDPYVPFTPRHHRVFFRDEIPIATAHSHAKPQRRYHIEEILV